MTGQFGFFIMMFPRGIFSEPLPSNADSFCHGPVMTVGCGPVAKMPHAPVCCGQTREPALVLFPTQLSTVRCCQSSVSYQWAAYSSPFLSCSWRSTRRTDRAHH